MKILIAGATGLIGSALVKECISQGISVNYLTTRTEKIKLDDTYKGYYWNPASGEIDLGALEGVSAIINLAGASVSKRWTTSYKQVILDSRLSSANLLYESIQNADHQITTYISASGISVYPSSNDQLYDESNLERSNSFLGKVTVQWEAAADQFANLGLSVVKVRTGIVLASNDGALPKLVKPIAMGVGSALGNGKQWQSWIHIEDMVGLYLHLLKNNANGVYNGVAPNPVTNQKMTYLIARQLKKTVWLPKVPVFVLKLLLGEMSDLVFESQLVSAKKSQDVGYRFRYVNLEKALENLL